MTKRHTQADWKRLGSAVQAARIRRRDLGWDEMRTWADAVERSTRILQGLERGETVGAATRRVIEDVLGWPPSYADRILDDEHADLSPEVSTPLVEQFLPLKTEQRDLDQYTTSELLDEIQTRVTEQAFELHQAGRPAIKHQRGRRRDDQSSVEVVEAMSPAERRSVMQRPHAATENGNGSASQ